MSTPFVLDTDRKTRNGRWLVTVNPGTPSETLAKEGTLLMGMGDGFPITLRELVYKHFENWDADTTFGPVSFWTGAYAGANESNVPVIQPTVEVARLPVEVSSPAQALAYIETLAAFDAEMEKP